MGFLLVLLTILKIIGIILAIIVGIILLLVAIILIVPIRYRGRLAYKDKVELKVKLTYLLHIITVIYELQEGELVRKIYIFGREYKKKPPKKKKRKRRKKRNKNTIVKPVTRTDLSTPQLKTENKTEGQSKTKPESTKQEADEESFVNKIKEIYNDFTGDKEMREDMIAGIKILWEFIKAILPKKHIIRIKFGTGEPARTGKLLGAIYAAAAMLWLRVVVTPYFEDKIFEAEADFKGTIRVLKLIKVYKDEKINDLKNRLG